MLTINKIIHQPPFHLLVVHATYDNSTSETAASDDIIDNRDDDNTQDTGSSPEEHMKHLAGIYIFTTI